MKKPFAWSFSTLTSYETCPKKYYHNNIKKDFKESFKGEAAEYGVEVHRALELRLKEGTPLPLGMRHLEKFALPIEAADGHLVTEQKLAMTEQFQPTGYFDDDVWVRGQIDVGKIVAHEKRATIFDYKTGKRKPDNTQLTIMSALLMAHMPEIDYVTAAFIWLKDRSIDKARYCREDLPSVWNELLPRVNRMHEAYKTDDYPAKQNGLCRRWCPVKTCMFHGDQVA